MKLHQSLENLFKRRINSNDEIISYIKKLSEEGKFDEPKKIAVIAMMLDRIGKLEDEAEIERSVLGGKPNDWKEKNITKGFTSAMKDYKIDPLLVTDSSGDEKIQSEIDEVTKEKEETILKTTDSSMMGVSSVIRSESENEVFLEHKPFEISNTKENVEFVCMEPGCGKAFSSRIGLIGHRRTHAKSPK